MHPEKAKDRKMPQAAEIIGDVVRLHCSQCRYCATTRAGRGEAVARAFSDLGWANVGGTSPRCPDCVNKLRVVSSAKSSTSLNTVAAALVDAARPAKGSTMTAKPTEKPATVEPLRQMTAEDGRRIFLALQEAYDADRGLYLLDGSDERTAKEIGVLWGWVRDVREKFFGSGGMNEQSAVAAEVEEIRGMIAAADSRLKRIDDIVDKLSDVQSELIDLREQMVPQLKARLAKLKGTQPAKAG